ncbi:MAG: GNAT family N-acetyltransferase [Chloroflexi bacterium]|nr:GNAT family N-acetyltransferase [Chloroflexota bacterium]
MAQIDYSVFQLKDYDQAAAFWQRTPYIGLSSADTREAIGTFLSRNPGFSFAARDGDALAGTVLIGHDGRRGYMYHLAVAAEYRGQGIARELIRLGLDALRDAGIEKCHLFVYTDNQNALEFYRHEGWQQREELVIFSMNL